MFKQEAKKCYHYNYPIYNFAFVCAFFRIGSIFVAFMTSPFIFSFPDMNSRCACVFPLTSLPKSSSDSDKVTIDPSLASVLNSSSYSAAKPK